MHALKSLVVVAAFCVAPTLAKSADTAPASTSRAAEAVVEGEIRSATKAYIQAVVDADEKALLSIIALKDEDAAKEARAILGASIARQQLDGVLNEAFGPADIAPAALEKKRATIDGITKELDKAEVTVAGYSATVKALHTAIPLVRDNGTWKIDFIAIQRSNEGPFDVARVNAALAKIEIYRDVITKVKQHAYKTRMEAVVEAQVRMGKLSEPETRAITLAKMRATIGTMAGLLTAIDTFEVDNGRYPTTGEGLQALTTRPTGMKDWHKAMDDLPVDGWGNAFDYKLNADGISFEISSAGPDRTPGTADDINQHTKMPSDIAPKPRIPIPGDL